MKEQFIHVDEDGDKFYYSDKAMTIRHREDGPAIEYADGDKEWFINGKLHREDGHAVEYANGYKAWWINDNELTEAEFNKLHKPSCEGKIVTIDGKKYKLTNIN